MRIEKLIQEHGVNIKWIHFPLHPDTPADGQPLEVLFAGRGYDLDKMHEEMSARMAAEGLPYNRRTHTYNSRLAQELGAWADTQPGGAEIHDALYRAYFVDGLNVGDPEVLVSIAKAVGLDETEARRVIEQRTCKELIDNDWNRSRAMGVTGVPTFAAGGYGLVGAQPYEALSALVSQAKQVESDDS